MSNIVKFANAGLPMTVASVASMAAALRQVASEVGVSGGVAMLKMDKTGCWVYGAEQTEVQEGSQWAVNPFSFVHGYIAWGEGDVLGEKMTSVSQPLPELDAAPAGSKRGWEMQVGMSLKCLNGDDEGMDVRFSATSVGGKRAVQELAVAIAAQIDVDQTRPVPVVEFGKESYQHKSYGRIFTPALTVQRWMGMDGDAEAPAAPVKIAAPVKVARAPVAAPAPAAAPEVEPEADPQEDKVPVADVEAPRRRRRVVS